MREIVLDTETTGFSFDSGDRLVEVGAIEIDNLMPTGRYCHLYINPERDMPVEAFNVHGLSQEFLQDKPIFEDVADEFISFIGDAPLVIHNAPFDMGFLDGELQAIGKPKISNKVIDTLSMARRMFPNKHVSLDALCRIFKIDNSRRTLHGALLDSEILASVYMELRGGRNYNMSLGSAESEKVEISVNPDDLETEAVFKELDPTKLFKPSETEIAENTAFRKKNGFEHGNSEITTDKV